MTCSCNQVSSIHTNVNANTNTSTFSFHTQTGAIVYMHANTYTPPPTSHPTNLQIYTQHTHSPNCSFFGYVQCVECSGICIYLEWRHQCIFETLTVIASCLIGLQFCMCFNSDTKMKIVCVCRLFLLSFGKEVGTVDTYTYRLIPT